MESPEQPINTFHNNAVVQHQVGTYVVHGNFNYHSAATQPHAKQCLQAFTSRDGQLDVSRIQIKKDPLLHESCHWILSDRCFADWWSVTSRGILWLHGDPGKGKTMAAIFLIKDLAKRIVANQASQPSILTYFFCDASNDETESAISVLRGLINLMIREHESLLNVAIEHHQRLGNNLFDGEYGLYALWRLLTDMLQCLPHHTVYIVVDALDECRLLQLEFISLLIHQMPRGGCRVKMMITSRNSPQLKAEIISKHDYAIFDLDLEARNEEVSQAVNTFIDWKVNSLREIKKYNQRLVDEIRQYLMLHAEGTFLWVWLVCKELSKAPTFKTMTILRTFPSGLIPLYTYSFGRIRETSDEDTLKYCRKILRGSLIAFRPLEFEAYLLVADLPADQFAEGEHIQGLIELCASFLTIRGGVVQFVHASAHEFIQGSEQMAWLLADIDNHDNPKNDLTLCCVHQELAARALSLLNESLKEDICDLDDPGVIREDVTQEHIDQGIPSSLQYACIYWADHLTTSMPSAASARQLFTEEDLYLISRFFKNSFLHWIEVLSLLQRLSVALTAMTQLEQLQLINSDSELFKILQDAKRFIAHCQGTIEIAPLQIYHSVLAFCPKESQIRQLYLDRSIQVNHITAQPEQWTACLHVMEGHTDSIEEIKFSPDGKWIISCSLDHNLMIWDIASGTILHKLTGHRNFVSAIDVSSNGTFAVSGSCDRRVRLWNTRKGSMICELKGHQAAVETVKLSPCGSFVASGSWDGYIRLWNVESKCLKLELEAHSKLVESVVFSPSGRIIASGSWDQTVKLWEVETGHQVHMYDLHQSKVRIVVFSSAGTWLASGGDGDNVVLMNLRTHTIRNLPARVFGPLKCIAFSNNEAELVIGGSNGAISVLNTVSGKVLTLLMGHSAAIRTMVFSRDSQSMLSGSMDGTVREWNFATRETMQVFRGHSSCVSTVAYSPIGQKIASGSWDRTIRLWERDSILSENNVYRGHDAAITAVAISADESSAVSASADGVVKLWDLAIDTSPVTICALDSSPDFVATSGKVVAVATDPIVNLLHIYNSEAKLLALLERPIRLQELLFSTDHQVLLMRSKDGQYCIRHMARGWTEVTPIAYQNEVHKHTPAGIEYLWRGQKIRIWSADQVQSMRRTYKWKQDRHDYEDSPANYPLIERSLVVFGGASCLVSTVKDKPYLLVWDALIETAVFKLGTTQIISDLRSEGDMIAVHSTGRQVTVDLRRHSPSSSFDLEVIGTAPLLIVFQGAGLMAISNGEKIFMLDGHSVLQFFNWPGLKLNQRMAFSQRSWLAVTNLNEAFTGVELYDMAGYHSQSIVSEILHIEDMRFLRDDMLCLTAKDEAKVEVWRLGTQAPQAILRIKSQRFDQVTCLGSKYLLLEDHAASQLKIWSISQAKLHRSIDKVRPSLAGCYIASDKFIPFMRRNETQLSIINAETGTVVHSIETDMPSMIGVSSETDNLLAGVGYLGSRSERWNTETGKLVNLPRRSIGSFHSLGRLPQGALDADNLIFTSLTSLGGVHELNLENGTDRYFRGWSLATYCIVARSREQLLALLKTGTSHIDICDGASGTMLCTLDTKMRHIRHIAFSHSEHLAALGSKSGDDDIQVQVWQARSSQMLWSRNLAFHLASSIALLGESTVAITGFDWERVLIVEKDRLWGFTRSVFADERRDKDKVLMQFSLKKQLAIQATSKIIRIYDYEDGTLSRTIHSQLEQVQGFDFSSDGSLWLYGNPSWAVKIWDTETGHCYGCLRTLDGDPLQEDTENLSHVVKFLPERRFVIRHQGDLYTLDLRRVFYNTHLDNALRPATAKNIESLASLGMSVGPSTLVQLPGDGIWVCVHFSEIDLGDQIGYIEDDNDDANGVEVRSEGETSEIFKITSRTPSSMDHEGIWVLFRGRRFLRLPPELRSGVYRFAGSKLILGSKSGRVTILQLNHPRDKRPR